MLEKSDLESIRNIVEETIRLELKPIKQKLFVIEEDIKFLGEKIDKIAKTNSEDIVAINNDIQEIKQKQTELELRVKVLEPQEA